MASLPFTLMRHLIFRAQKCKCYIVKGYFQKKAGRMLPQFRPYCYGIGCLCFPSKISLLTVILFYFLAVQIMSLQSINHHLKRGRFRLQKQFVLREIYPKFGMFGYWILGLAGYNPRSLVPALCSILIPITKLRTYSCGSKPVTSRAW